MARGRPAISREGNEIEFSRIVAFSDGVFAIAITLLVLNLRLPENLADGEVAKALWGLRDNFLAFAVSFAVIGRFWVIHHRFFGTVTGFNAQLIGLNLLYLGSIVLVAFSSEVIGEYGDSTAAVVFYSVNLAAVVLIGMLMGAHAYRHGLTTEGREEHAEARIRSLYVASIFVVSIPVAFVVPGWAPVLWLALFVDVPGMLGSRASS